jgi:SAM-dependent methyltransferase
MTDHYSDGTYLWWHLSAPSPEIVSALDEGWLPAGGRALDVGCGLGVEASYLTSKGWKVVGIDLSEVALSRAAAAHRDPAFVRADVRRLPLGDRLFDVAIDRGCFHYLERGDRPRYSSELTRILRPGAKLLLRASLYAAGVRNDVDETVVRETFTRWRIESMERAAIPSDTRELEVLVVRMCKAATPRG